MKKILIIGGVAGGAAAAARLRRLDETAEIILFERGEHISFANCGLPYYIGGTIAEQENLLVQSPAGFKRRFNVDVRTKNTVVAIDRSQKSVTVQDGRSNDTYTERYDKLILAPGAAPIRPPLPGLNDPRVFSLRDIADAENIKNFIREQKPQRAAIIGGGFIGMEMAENLSALGMDVSVIEMAEQVIAPLDADLACDVHRHLVEQGVSLYLGNALEEISTVDDGLLIKLSQATLAADMVVLAIGVRPENQLAKDCGLSLGERGHILCDAHMRTSDPDIYAAGDAVEVVDFVTGQKAAIPLAGPAAKQGRIAADNICGIPSAYDGTQGSAIIKVFDLCVATTGVNEKTARRLGLNYDKIFLWLPGHAGYYPGTHFMSMKVIFEKSDGRILGAQIVGTDGVDKRMDILAMAVRLKLTAQQLTQLELCYAPPYSSAKDPVNMAGYVIENCLAGRLQQFHWDALDTLPRDGSVTLLDVRSPQEVNMGRVAGFVNIPVDELRGRLPELDPAKPVYALCHSGLRSYVAARILAQNGFDVYSLGGGYRLYAAVKRVCC